MGRKRNTVPPSVKARRLNHDYGIYVVITELKLLNLTQANWTVTGKYKNLTNSLLQTDQNFHHTSAIIIPGKVLYKLLYTANMHTINISILSHCFDRCKQGPVNYTLLMSNHTSQFADHANFLHTHCICTKYPRSHFNIGVL